MRVLLLVGGAGAVIGTAAALSGLAARSPELPAGRWSAPLPAMLVRIADARTTRTLLRIAGLAATVAGIIALAGHDAPADGLVAIAVLSALSLVCGPVYRLVNPVRALAALRDEPPTDRDGNDSPTGHRDALGAALWLVAMCAIALSTRNSELLAATAGAYVLLQTLLLWLQRGRRVDPFETLAALLGHLAPIGRDDHRRLVVRNPLVAISHAELAPGSVRFGAVVVAASLAHAALGYFTWRRGIPFGGEATVVFGVALAVVAGVLRLSVIRPFFRSATVPLVAAYGVVAAGPWWRPLDLLVFVALHVVAVGVLHRQAIVRYDLRTARAVQFPLRIALVASVVGGLALLAGR